MDLVEKDKKLFALKTFNPKDMKEDDKKDKALMYFRSEIEIMKMCNHPNLVNYIDSICENG